MGKYGWVSLRTTSCRQGVTGDMTGCHCLWRANDAKHNGKNAEFPFIMQTTVSSDNFPSHCVHSSFPVEINTIL
jgi:hypothetical protein